MGDKVIFDPNVNDTQYAGIDCMKFLHEHSVYPRPLQIFQFLSDSLFSLIYSEIRGISFSFPNKYERFAGPSGGKSEGVLNDMTKLQIFFSTNGGSIQGLFIFFNFCQTVYFHYFTTRYR